ncbi:MAG TPA: hypothetical protein VGS78_15465 [Candidatus Sulfotelmatobacter sp.]|nr:hypothetical protein [Candidatus Sulfotelmatobacter sp.]
MSTTSLRSAMVPVSRKMRAFFAPVNRGSETPTIFDPGASGMFSLDAPPVPWVDLGWVENFARWYETPTDVVQSGAKAMPAGQFRGPLEARVEFDFRQWGKLQMALACGSEHMNVLAPVAGNVSPAPSGGAAAAAVAVLPGSTASELIIGSGVGSVFAGGCLVAVDADYQQQVGYVGSGIAAAYVSSAAAVKQDPDYVRRVTFNVGRVAEVTATSVVLAQPLLGGAPLAGASAQVVVAFVDREGGSFFQEWSALFVAEEESGGRVCFYYPRLSASTARGASGRFAREGLAEIAKPVSAVALHASFLALPFVDTNDGQTVLCYRSYFPAAMAGMY